AGGVASLVDVVLEVVLVDLLEDDRGDGAVRGDEERRGIERDLVVLGDLPGGNGAALGIAPNRIGHAELVGEVDRGLLAVALGADADEHHIVVLMLFPGGLERRHLVAARLTPRSPEIHDNDLTAMLGERERLAGEGLEGKVGGGLADARPLDLQRRRLEVAVLPHRLVDADGGNDEDEDGAEDPRRLALVRAIPDAAALFLALVGIGEGWLRCRVVLPGGALLIRRGRCPVILLRHGSCVLSRYRPINLSRGKLPVDGRRPRLHGYEVLPRATSRSLPRRC